MGAVDHLARARAELTNAEGARADVAAQLVTRAQAHATIAVAEALAVLASSPYAVPGHVVEFTGPVEFDAPIAYELTEKVEVDGPTNGGPS